MGETRREDEFRDGREPTFAGGAFPLERGEDEIRNGRGLAVAGLALSRLELLCDDFIDSNIFMVHGEIFLYTFGHSASSLGPGWHSTFFWRAIFARIFSSIQCVVLLFSSGIIIIITCALFI